MHQFFKEEMVSLHKLAELSAGFLAKRLQLDEEKREIISYGAFVLIQNLFTLTIVAAIAALAGILRETLVIVLVFGALRVLGGGIHFQTAAGCIVTSAVVLPLLGFASAVLSSPFYSVSAPGQAFLLAAISIFSLAAILLFVPKEHQNHPLSGERKKILRRSTLAVGCIFIAVMFCSASGFIFSRAEAVPVGMALVFQSLNLVPAGEILVNRVKGRFGFIELE